MSDWSDFVGRENLLATILNGGAGTGAFYDVRGIAGAGKSVLLRELERRIGGEHVVVLIDAKDYFTAFEQKGATPGGQAADPRGEFLRFIRVMPSILLSVADRLPEAMEIFKDVLDEMGQLRLDSESVPATVGGTRTGAASLADEGRFADQVGKLIGRLQEQTNALVDLYGATGKRLFFMIDTFELVLKRPLSRWLVALLGGLRHAVVVVARRTTTQHEPGLPGSTATIEVGGLTADQVNSYLVGKLGPQGAEIATAVFDFTEGHALAVGLTADLVLQRCRNEGEVASADLLDMLWQLAADRDDSYARLGRLIDTILNAVRDNEPAVYRGLECLWVVRRFDVPLLRHLLAVGSTVGGGDDAGALQLTERLIDYSFTEPRKPPDRPADRYYIVHEFVRAHGLRILLDEYGRSIRTAEQSRLQELHRSAEAYYQDQTAGFLDGYEGWFRYEDTRWQTMVREWLYHVAHLDDDARLSSQLGLARLFLDAFRWWGKYIPFDFCDQLLMDWAEMAKSRAEAKEGNAGTMDGGKGDWGESLRVLNTRYPKGWRKQDAPTADWRAVRDAVLSLRDRLAEIEPNLAIEPGRLHHIRALLDNFAATAIGYLDPHDPRVVELLDDAQEQFAANNDEWNVAWTAFHQADAALERGDGDAAIAVVDTKVDAPSRLGDSELAANFHRVHADAAWARGDHGRSLDCYARAALHAYKFQIASGDPEIPPTDEYTQTFLTEMHERTAERLAELRAAGERQAAHAACSRIRRFFGPYWDVAGVGGPPELHALFDAGHVDQVVRHLFPPPPAPSDLHKSNTAYALTAGEVLYEMEHELAEPPGTPLH